MKRYLIRAGFDPYLKQNIDPDDCVWRSYVGGNSGNLMFAYGVMNALKTEDTELSFNYNWSFTDREIAEINEKYDAYILPLADAFRVGFKKQISGLTEAVKRLKIPAIVIGCAVRADYEPDFESGFEFDDLARDFMKAVLEKSTIVGVRGELTGKYLSHLGFKEDRDFTPIGCPSLYTYGLSVKTREVPVDIKRLVVNTNGYYDVGFINDFLLNTVEKFPGYYLVQQLQAEFRDMYIGKKWLPALLSKRGDKSDKMLIKGKLLRDLYKNDRVRYFFDVPSWVSFMKQFDLFVGNRFHGSVAAVLAGCPHVMIPFNARTRELTEYHYLTSLKPDEIREGTSILDYLDALDFQSFTRHQESNLSHYVDFLDANGLDHIFKKKKEFHIGESPLERKIKWAYSSETAQKENIVQCYDSLPFYDKAIRAVKCNLKGFNPKNIKSILR